MHPLLDELRTYLKSPSDFHTGVELLFRITHRSGLRESLLKFQDRAKLLSHLQEQYRELSSTKDIEDKPPILSQKSVQINDNILTGIDEKRVKLFKQLSHYHTLMGALDFDSENDPIRYQYMEKCVSIDAELFQLRQDKIYYERTGSLPMRVSVPKDIGESEAQMILRIKQLQPSIQYDIKLIASLESQLKSANVMDDIAEISSKLDKARTRLASKEAEILRLRAATSH